jgi:streptomycin 6-kinase
VLHGDLHHHNLLASERATWLAADPKGLVGPRQAEAAALLRNPRHFILGHPDRAALLADRVAILAERLDDDAARIAGWSYVLAVVAARWAADDREGDAEVTRWLACADALRGVARSHGVA